MLRQSECQGVGELDSFTQIVSKMSRTWVVVCRGGSFRLRRKGESGGGTVREHTATFRKEEELAACEIIISYRHDGKEDKLT